MENLEDLVASHQGSLFAFLYRMCGDADLAEELMTRLSYAEVRTAIVQLPLEQRSALTLRYYHDLSYADIARVLACPIGTVRSRIHNGVDRLKRMLMEEVPCHAGR